MKYLAYILTGAILLSACSRYSFNEEIATLDSLITDYNKLKILVDSMSNIKSKHYLTAYTKDIKVLKKAMNPNKMPSLEHTQYIDAFRSVKKTFKKYPKHQSSLQNNIKKNLDQLNRLKSDIRKQVFDSTSVYYFLQQEEVLFQNLQKEYIKTLQNTYKEIAKYDSLKALLPKKLKSLHQ